MIVTRDVTPIKSVTRAVTVPVTRDVSQQSYLLQQDSKRVEQHVALMFRVEALERALAELRELIARQAVAPSTNKRAAYMREYRKRAKV